jgi:hypothetical protein
MSGDSGFEIPNSIFKIQNSKFRKSKDVIASGVFELES